jgi:hypothetical protein
VVVVRVFFVMGVRHGGDSTANQLIHPTSGNKNSRKFVTLGIVEDEMGEEIHTPFPCTRCGEGEWTPRPGRTYESRLREEAH